LQILGETEGGKLKQKMENQDYKHDLRRKMRTRRRAMSVQQLNIAERGLLKSARHSNRLLNAQQLLSYAPFAGEISPSRLVSKLSTNNIWFPRITNFRTCSMLFYPANRLDSLNKYGIVEPKAVGTPPPANAFDVMLIPLVAFDRKGSRVGMGAGYYDRALSALAHQSSTRPFLVGLAHHFQEAKSLTPAPWDVPLDAILTDHEFISI